MYTDFGVHDFGRSVAIQPDGKIVVAGSADLTIAVARYKGDSPSIAYDNNNYSFRLQKEEVNSNKSATLFHNPAKDVLHVENLCAGSCGSSSSKTISIIDAKGKLLQQVTTTSNRFSFKVKQLPAGIYFIRIDEAEKNRTLKFVKE